MASPRSFLLVPCGSAGDVYPFVGLAKALQQRAHEVTIFTSGYFRDLVEGEGISFVDTLPADQFVQLMEDPDLWHPMRGAQTVFKAISRPILAAGYQMLVDNYQPGRSVLVGSVLALAGRLAHEKLGAPLATVDLQPTMLWSEFDTPRLPGLLAGPLIPGFLKRWQFNAGVRWVLEPAIRPALEPLRKQLGLPPLRGLLQWWHSPQCIIGMFPDWFAPPQPDWPPNVHLTSFPLWEADLDQPLPDDVRRFLDAGEPPIVFTPGSANLFGREFFQAAADACEKLGRRGMLMTRYPEQIPASLPTGVEHFSYAPFVKLLPHAAAISHHGGIGTAAAGLAAGIPQLIMPLSHDQPDNAARLKRLNVGDWLVPKKYRGRAVASKLQRLITDSSVAAACQQRADQLAGVRPYDAVCAILESL